MNSISDLLLQKSIKSWDDNAVAEFDREIKDRINRIEDIALSSEDCFLKTDNNGDGQQRLIFNRMNQYINKLESIIGSEESETIIKSFISKRYQGEAE